jgi:hypothetical protein
MGLAKICRRHPLAAVFGLECCPGRANAVVAPIVDEAAARHREFPIILAKSSSDRDKLGGVDQAASNRIL